jgi:hypothetical protein
MNNKNGYGSIGSASDATATTTAAAAAAVADHCEEGFFSTRMHQITKEGKIVPYLLPHNYIAYSDANDDASPMYWIHVDAHHANNNTSFASNEEQRIKNWQKLEENISSSLGCLDNNILFGPYISNQLRRPIQEWISHVKCTRTKALLKIRVMPSSRPNDERDDDEEEHKKMIIARRVIQHWQKQRINKQKKHANYSAANVFNNSMVVDEQCSIDHAEYHAAVITKSILFTYATATTPGAAHHATNATIDYMIRGNDEQVVLHDGSSSAALLSWLEFHLLNTQNALTKLRQVSKFISKRMDIYPESITIKDILNLQDDILSVLSVTEEQTHCLDMLHDIDVQCDGVNFTNVDGTLSMLVKTAKSNEMLGTRLERRVLGIKTAFTTHQQDKMNKRLAVLTTLSAIFMPLTFIAGVYGMNFEYLPELHYHYAYFVVLIIMFVLGAGMIVYFKFNGWFS